MEAKETTLRNLLNGSIQFVVPLFQRTYAWREANWRSLWADVLEVYLPEGQPHFLGPLVTKHWTSTPEGVSKFLLIDGQQRLTTLSLMLAALRDNARESTDGGRADRIEGLHLQNQFVKGEDRLKVLPTQADRPPFASIINSDFKEKDPEITGAYEFFAARLREKDPDGNPIDLARLETSILDGLELVSIKLGGSDNEYRIFESLNGKGVALSQADLLRNYVFMSLPTDRHSEVYEHTWLPMQRALVAARGHQSDLEAFFRYALMVRLSQFVREDSVFSGWRELLDSEAKKGGKVEDAVMALADEAGRYVRIIAPSHEANAEVREGLRRLNRWGGQTMYPLLLKVFATWDAGKLDARGVAAILAVVESFLVRRMFCRVPTNALNRLFARIWEEVSDDQKTVDGLRTALSGEGKRWPADEEFTAALRSYPLYSDSRPDQRKIVLERLDGWQNKEAPADYSNFSIEHIMPQTLTETWNAQLGADAAKVHQTYLHTLGNLTLTAYNPEMSNKPFNLPDEPASLPPEVKPRTKRQWFNRSGTRMSQTVAKSERWTAAEMDARAMVLATTALEVWPGPNK